MDDDNPEQWRDLQSKRETPKQSRPNGKRLTRKRIPLSCIACRIRKLKCNREKPCQNCIVRGEGTLASCTYAEKVDGKQSTKSNPRSDAEDMRKRINRLENSILSMMGDAAKAKPQKKQTSQVTAASLLQDDETFERVGRQEKFGSTHWDAILDDLGAMKEAWSEENDQVELSKVNVSQSPQAHRPSLLNGLTPPPDQSIVLASLPPKDQADILISRFFDSYNPLLPGKYLVHQDTFLKKYAKHWEDPKRSEILWVGLLFGMLGIALQSYRINKEEPPHYLGTAAATAELFRVRTAQCIVIADITKPAKLMVETLLAYSMLEYSDEGDYDSGTWILSGTVTRLALQQNYHRDPSQQSNISVFDGEMRRRVWAMVWMYELLLCIKTGFPTTMHFSESDTTLPSNIYEYQLHEHMETLPTSRLLMEETPISYFITKILIVRAYGRVIEFIHNVKPHAYSEVMKLDFMLLEAQEMIPSYLRVQPLDKMTNDPPFRIMERYLLSLFYHKAICLLHRKYWTGPHTQNNSCSDFYSRKTSVSSAMILLDQQSAMQQACLPGGKLSGMKWYNFAITNHDFLLAVMVVCLDLMAYGPLPECIVTAVQKFDAIKRARCIWSSILGECKDARRAVDVLDRLIPKLAKKVDETRTIFAANRGVCSPAAHREVSASAFPMNHNPDALQCNPYFTDHFGLGASLHPAPEDNLIPDELLSSGGIIDSIGSDINLPADFDWDAWDQLLANQPPGQQNFEGI